MTKIVKLPKTKSGWASLLLGMGLLIIGCAHWIDGNFAQASLDFSGAFGTLGLPSLAGTGWHVEVRKDVPDPSAPFTPTDVHCQQ